MIHQILHRLYMGIVTIGCTMLWTLSGCDNDTLDSFLQFSDDNLLLRAAGDTVVIDVTAGSGWEAGENDKYTIALYDKFINR